MGLVQALLGRGDSVGAETAKAIKAHHEEVNPSSPEHLGELVRFCRLDKMYKEDQRRITFSVANPAIRTHILKALSETGAQKKLGRAPPSRLEWELQPWLEALLEV